jgi:STE24 endopeptidase
VTAATLAQVFSPERQLLAAGYADDRYFVFFLEAVVTILVFVGIWRFRATRRLPPSLSVAALVLLFIAVRLPFAAWRHLVAVRYHMAGGGWLREQLVDDTRLAAACVVAALAYFAWRRRAAFLLPWVVLAPLIFWQHYLDPEWLQPARVRHTVLPNTPLVDRLDALAARAGYTVAERWLQTVKPTARGANAELRGRHSAPRLVVWDTTLARMSWEQIQWILAHKIGHFRMQHALWRTVAEIVALLVALALVSRKLRVPAQFPAFMVLLALATPLWTPVENAVLRRQEQQADVFGIHLLRGTVGDPCAVAVEGFAYFADAELIDPTPSRLGELWFHNHRRLEARIDFARSQCRQEVGVQAQPVVPP